MRSRQATRPDRVLLVMVNAQLVRTAVEIGLTVWCVAGRCEPGRAVHRPDCLCEIEDLVQAVLRADADDVAAVRALVADTVRLHGIGHVLGHVGGHAAEVPTPDSVRLLGDNVAVRRLLNGSGRSWVRAREARTVPEVRAAAAEVTIDFTRPAVVRSAASSGPGTAALRNAVDLERWSERAARGATRGPYLVEELMVGPELDVTTVTVHGMHHVVGITARRTSGSPDFVTLGHRHPVRLPERERAELCATVTALLDLTGHESGAVTTGVILTVDGPRVVGSGATRGTDPVPRLIGLSTGSDLDRAVLLAIVGERIEPSTPRRFAALEFLHTMAARPGRFVVVGATAEQVEERASWARTLLVGATPDLHRVPAPLPGGGTGSGSRR